MTGRAAGFRDLAALPHEAKAVLAREYLLAGHLNDRASMPHVLGRFGAAEMNAVAIDEWMGASPVYTRRMQRALRFQGDDVATIFKGIQLDVGAPPEFMDFRFRVDSPTYGEFWLAHCGALMDVEPMGEEMVRGMCHDIEDPTFDATAIATNGRARVRPLHRPPRVPAARHPHCHWKVFIDEAADPLPEPEQTAAVQSSRAAAVTIERPPEGHGAGGRPYYDGDLDPDLELERFSPAALTVVAEEACLQGHLLVRSMMAAIAGRHGTAAAEEIASAQVVGVGAVAAERLAKALVGLGDGLDRVAAVLELHPAFRPAAYVDLAVEHDDGRLRVALRDCEALREADERSWVALLARDGDPHPALQAIVSAVEPRARVHAGDGPGSWDVVLDPDAGALPEPGEVALTRISRGAAWVFRRPVAAVGTG